MTQQPSAEEQEDVTLADLFAAHRVERLGPLGSVKCHACDDWTEGTIHDHHAALAASWYEAISTRLAAVEALVECWKANAGADRDIESRTLREVVAYLGAALHADPSEAGA